MKSIIHVLPNIHTLQLECSQNITVVESYTLNLKAGWNYISIPVEPIDSSIKTVLSSIWSYITSTISSYQNGKWLSWVIPWDTGDLTKITSEYGYIIKLSQNANLTVSGIPNTNKISLISGWNLVGFRSNYTNMVDNYIVPSGYGIISSAEQIWGSDPAKYNCYPSNASVDCTGLLITTSKLHGYWINIKDIQIVNSNFEGTGGWNTEKIGSDSLTNINLQSADTPYSGSYYAKIQNNVGIVGTERAAFIRQTLTIPINASTLNCVLKYWKDSWGPGMGIRLGNAVIETIGIGGTAISSGWVTRSYNITAFHGKTVTLEIFLDDRSGAWSGNADHGGWIGIDDISIS